MLQQFRPDHIWLEKLLSRVKARDLFQVSLAKLSWENGFTKNLGQNQTRARWHATATPVEVAASCDSLDCYNNGEGGGGTLRRACSESCNGQYGFTPSSYALLVQQWGCSVAVQSCCKTFPHYRPIFRHSLLGYCRCCLTKCLCARIWSAKNDTKYERTDSNNRWRFLPYMSNPHRH